MRFIVWTSKADRYYMFLVTGLPFETSLEGFRRLWPRTTVAGICNFFDAHLIANITQSNSGPDLSFDIQVLTHVSSAANNGFPRAKEPTVRYLNVNPATGEVLKTITEQS